MKILIFTILCISIFVPISVFALLPPQTDLEKFVNADIVLMGTVNSTKIIEGSEVPQTSYNVIVTRNLKGEINEKIIPVISNGAKDHSPIEHGKIFELNDKVFLYLVISEGKYIVSPHSRVYYDNFTEFLIPPPLKLIKNGIPIENIPCKSFYQKIIKPSGTLACVTPQTADLLVLRNWEIVK